jgi:uncharacterized repeat protein (TIGR03803 family)
LRQPYGPLTLDSAGSLYGTTYAGGTYSQGGVFELKRSAKGWAENVLYNFTGGSDGGQPYQPSLVWDSAGNLYGTTETGGNDGLGVVFELTPTSGGSWTETVLHSFTGVTDGWLPDSGVIIDKSGNLYGTAFLGGGYGSCFSGLSCGTVYQLTPSMGEWTFSVLHAFDGSDGGNPAAGLIFDAAGNLYGATAYMENDGPGVIFRLSPSEHGWAESVLHRFDEEDGAEPFGGLVFDKRGVLYGTAEWGGKGDGVVFSLRP